MSHFTLNGTPRERILRLVREIASAAKVLGDLSTATGIRHHSDFIAARRRLLRELLHGLTDGELAEWREFRGGS